MRKILILLLGSILLTGILHCSSSSGGNGPAAYQVTIAPIQTNWPIVRETSGQWEIVGEGMCKNVGTETVVISTVALKVFNAN